MASGATADDLKYPLTLAAHAKSLCRTHHINESLVDTRDIALAYVDRFDGSGADASAATANITNWDLPLGS
jgi:hypothetical protein